MQGPDQESSGSRSVAFREIHARTLSESGSRKHFAKSKLVVDLGGVFSARKGRVFGSDGETACKVRPRLLAGAEIS